ncbi:MAG: 2'-5' RNA ligase family protein, partial [Gluconobacter sp.]
ITQRFLGGPTERALSRLSWKPFDISFSGAGLREGMTADSLTIGIERSAALETLQAQVEKTLRKAGCAPAKRRFQPSVTLGHLATTHRADAARWVQRHNLFRSEPMPVEHVTLFESLRGYDQHVYVAQAEYAWHPEMPLLPEDE